MNTIHMAKGTLELVRMNHARVVLVFTLDSDDDAISKYAEIKDALELGPIKISIEADLLRTVK